MLLALSPILMIVCTFFLRKRKREAILVTLFVCLYIATFFFVTATADIGYAVPGSRIDDIVATGLRVFPHLFFFSTFVFFLLVGKNRLFLEWKIFLPFLLIPVFMGISGIMGGNSNELFRAGLLLIYYVNVFFLFRFSSYQKDQMITLYIYLALTLGIVSCFCIAIYGNFPIWSERLGRPWNPRVLSAALTIALILSMHRSKAIAIILFVMILATGSRLSIAVGCIALYSCLREYRVILVLFLIPVILFVGYESIDSLTSSLIDRSDITSGRLTGWLKAMELIPKVWLWGVGERFAIDVDGEAVRLHNAFFESLVSYGIFYTLSLTMTYYLVLRIQREYWQKLLALYIFAELLLGTLTWTNLGDPISLVGLVILLPSINHFKSGQSNSE